MGPALKPVIIACLALQCHTGWARKPPTLPQPPCHCSPPASIHSLHLDEQGFHFTESQTWQEDAAWGGRSGGATSRREHSHRCSVGEHTLHLLGNRPGQEGGQLSSSHIGKSCTVPVLPSRKELRTLTKDTLHPGRCLLGLLPSERCYSVCRDEDKVLSVATITTLNQQKHNPRCNPRSGWNEWRRSWRGTLVACSMRRTWSGRSTPEGQHLIRCWGDKAIRWFEHGQSGDSEYLGKMMLMLDWMPLSFYFYMLLLTNED